MDYERIVHGGNAVPSIVTKEWGHETLFGVTPRVALKQVTLKPGAALSRQVHMQKDELYLVIEGSGLLELGREAEIVHKLAHGDVVHIPPQVVHRLIAGNVGIVIIEASTPEVTDIMRLDDHYGRATNPRIDIDTYGNVLRA